MIQITYSSREPPSIVIQGHSGYATRGSDIVCAAVSTLFLSLVNSLGEYTDDVATVRTEPGDGALIWRKPISDNARLLLNSYMLGLRGVAEEYPDYVKFEIV